MTAAEAVAGRCALLLFRPMCIQLCPSCKTLLPRCTLHRGTLHACSGVAAQAVGSENLHPIKRHSPRLLRSETHFHWKDMQHIHLARASTKHSSVAAGPAAKNSNWRVIYANQEPQEDGVHSCLLVESTVWLVCRLVHVSVNLVTIVLSNRCVPRQMTGCDRCACAALGSLRQACCLRSASACTVNAPTIFRFCLAFLPCRCLLVWGATTVHSLCRCTHVACLRNCP